MEQRVLFVLPLKMTKASKQTHGSLLAMAMATAAAEGLFGISRDNPSRSKSKWAGAGVPAASLCASITWIDEWSIRAFLLITLEGGRARPPKCRLKFLIIVHNDSRWSLMAYWYNLGGLVLLQRFYFSFIYMQFCLLLYIITVQNMFFFSFYSWYTQLHTCLPLQ